MSSSTVVSSRRVSFEMQERFAALSGDRNPVHMDALAARRTQAGAPVVHGIHTLLWALERLVESGMVVSPIVRIKLKFPKWLYVGDESMLVLPAGGQRDPNAVRVEVAGMCILEVDLAYGRWPASASVASLHPAPAEPLGAAINRSLGDLAECEGTAYTASPDSAESLFPRLAEYLSGTTVAEIAACSYVVGMEVPGLNSMFSKLDLSVSGNLSAIPSTMGLHYRVTTQDERFRKVRIQVTGRGISGTLDAFVRQPPVEQASVRSMGAVVGSDEFERMRPLIIGGSRGLGELTAKLVAAGGGRPTISYAVGKADAERIAAEIRAWGGSVDVIPYDVRLKPAPQLAALRLTVTHLFYFATNPIFRPKQELLSYPILMDFVTYYLQGFYDLCLQLLKRGESQLIDGGNLCAYYPSSVAVEDRPAGMTEYSMVKAAGEQMCRDMNLHLPGLRILTTRLPRLRTDQTASIVPERGIDPISVLLPIIRQMKVLSQSQPD